jgi:hypothetical protein
MLGIRRTAMWSRHLPVFYASEKQRASKDTDSFSTVDLWDVKVTHFIYYYLLAGNRRHTHSKKEE